MLAPIACVKRAWRSFGRLSRSPPSAWFWAWSWDPLKFMRRHPPHHLSPARANHPAGQDPEARLNRSTSPQQRSDQDRKPVISEQQSCSSAMACAEIGSTGSKFAAKAVQRPKEIALTARRNIGMQARHCRNAKFLRHLLKKPLICLQLSRKGFVPTTISRSPLHAFSYHRLLSTANCNS